METMKKFASLSPEKIDSDKILSLNDKAASVRIMNLLGNQGTVFN